ncbi:MAG: alcohol dehydrogenase catalytic domain-containing protein, partial [Deltaproteobacteria bacterium]|nr:alcohol dehydrogenase catalytic domain-containing protein [Deltaproteobacteria bacterium]
MKAAIFKELGTPLVMGEVPKPEVNANEILMKVKAAAICIADIYSIKGERPLQLPHIMGHEAAGIVAEVGSEVRNFKPGDRILGNAIVTCNQCYYCKRDQEQVCENHKIIGTDAGTQGAFAEYYKLPAENMYHLPEEIPFDQATVITSPLASAYHGVRVADIQKGDTVVVYGGGAIGYHAMIGALTYDDVRVFMVDTVDEKLELAKKAGATAVINAEHEDPVDAVRRLTD